MYRASRGSEGAPCIAVVGAGAEREAEAPLVESAATAEAERASARERAAVSQARALRARGRSVESASRISGAARLSSREISLGCTAR